MLLSVQGTGWHLVHTCCIRFRKDIHSLVAGIITSRDSLDNNRNNQASWIKTLDVSLSYRSQTTNRSTFAEPCAICWITALRHNTPGMKTFFRCVCNLFLFLIVLFIKEQHCFWQALSDTGKVLTGRPIVINKRRVKLTQVMKGLCGCAALLHSKQLRFRRCSPFGGQPLYEPRGAVPLLITGNTGANNWPALPGPATALPQVLNQQFPCTHPALKIHCSVLLEDTCC